ncbi:MAG: LPS export ABC transporter periplasmic protein LptC [Blastocatellia bacterium]|nr:LPS export ABC transporter periplasmic protein LptC [Blastocatellia bacterium]
MANGNEKHLDKYRTRAALPNVLRYVVLGCFVIAVIALAAAFYRGRSTNGFKVRSEHTKLSAEVVANVDNYERLESDDGVPKLFVKAANAVTFADGHQELTDVYLKLYNDSGVEGEEMTSGRALYIPEADKNFTVYLKDNVNINGREGINIKSENIVYSKARNTAESDELVQFSQGGLSGQAFGAVVDIANQKLDLQRDVEIDNVAADGQLARVTASTAHYDHIGRRFDLRNDVKVNVKSPNNDVTDASAAQVSVLLNESTGENDKPSVKQLEMNENVSISSVRNGQTTNVTAAFAQYTLADERAELRGNANIATATNTLRAENAVYEPANLRASMNGGVEVTQGNDKATGDTVNVALYQDRSVRHVAVVGNAMVFNASPERNTTVRAPQIDAFWNTGQVISSAKTIGATTVNMIPAGNSSSTPITTTAARSIDVSFIGNGAIGRILTDGRTTIRIDGDTRAADGSAKSVTADSVKTDFQSDGKSIKRAEAVGNAELFIEPVKAADGVYKTRVNAPRFDCDFYASGNAAKLCVGSTKTRTVREPMFQKEGRGSQTILGDKLNASFSESPNDLTSLVIAGNAKFTELDRNAIASTITYTEPAGIVQLRGGEPTVWDNSSRAKAREIDWDSKQQRSSLRGKVSTTYYSKRSAGNAMPFSDSDKPVFVTSDNADFDHSNEVGVFYGNTRGWQDDNYVRAQKLTVLQREKRFLGEGNVQTTIYDAKQKDTKVPVYVTAGSLEYVDSSRLIKYRTNVDIRQGTDRLTSASADILLNEKNEVQKTITETNVVITQPGRRATGDRLEYTSSNEVAILRGSPATITDSVNGSTRGTEVTVYMKENRFTGNGKSPTNPSGRTRTVYKTDQRP